MMMAVVVLSIERKVYFLFEGRKVHLLEGFYGTKKPELDIVYRMSSKKTEMNFFRLLAVIFMGSEG